MEGGIIKTGKRHWQNLGPVVVNSEGWTFYRKWNDGGYMHMLSKNVDGRRIQRPVYRQDRQGKTRWLDGETHISLTESASIQMTSYDRQAGFEDYIRELMRTELVAGLLRPEPEKTESAYLQYKDSDFETLENRLRHAYACCIVIPELDSGTVRTRQQAERDYKKLVECEMPLLREKAYNSPIKRTLRDEDIDKLLASAAG